MSEKPPPVSGNNGYLRLAARRGSRPRAARPGPWRSAPRRCQTDAITQGGCRGRGDPRHPPEDYFSTNPATQRELSTICCVMVYVPGGRLLVFRLNTQCPSAARNSTPPSFELPASRSSVSMSRASPLRTRLTIRGATVPASHIGDPPQSVSSLSGNTRPCLNALSGSRTGLPSPTSGLSDALRQPSGAVHAGGHRAGGPRRRNAT